MTLRQFLSRIGWSQSELASRLSIPVQTVANWHAGRRRTPQPVLDWLDSVSRSLDEAGPPPSDWSENRPGPRPTRKTA